MRTIKKRRRENKTDYHSRLKLLKSKKSRIAIRKTNRYLTIQLIRSKASKDSVVVGANSKELLKYGWEDKNAGSLKSIPACYLTGLLLGSRMDKKEEVILDLGITRNVKKGKIYSALKGLVDAGVMIKYKEETFPDEKRIKGEHLKNKINFEDVKKNILKEGNKNGKRWI